MKQSKKSLKKIIAMIALGLLVSFLLLVIFGTVAHATGLVDDTINISNEYSKYSLSNYQLDFYVDNSWDWLPWNWGDGLGKSVMYALYAITNFIWTISLYLSNATGFLVQEAYKLDFISQTADAIGKNIQSIAGINEHGFTGSGFYIGFLLLLILVLGVYVAYTGMLKRETTKAFKAIMSFLIIFIMSASFIAYSPNYIKLINGFSKDVSHASLSVGTKLVMPESNNAGKDSVDIIRDSLFSVQIKQPWLLLQFDNSDVNTIGKDRVESILSINPDENAKDREDAVKADIEDNDNANLSITKTMSRLGIVFFLFIFNIGITIFVFLLTGLMIFSQVLFIIYAIFLPISFLLSMIPTFDGMAKKAITNLFNIIMARAGITLIISVAFSISTMLYKLSTTAPFFLIAFLQIVTFAGIYFKLGDLMGLFSLKLSDSKSLSKQVLSRPQRYLQRQKNKVKRGLSLPFSMPNKKKEDTPPKPAPNTQTSKTPYIRENTPPKPKELSNNPKTLTTNQLHDTETVPKEKRLALKQVNIPHRKNSEPSLDTPKHSRDNLKDLNSSDNKPRKPKEAPRHQRPSTVSTTPKDNRLDNKETNPRGNDVNSKRGATDTRNYLEETNQKFTPVARGSKHEG